MMSREDILDWGRRQDMIGLREYVLAHADSYSWEFEGPYNREELRSRLAEMSATAYSPVWSLLEMGAESAMEGRLSESDPWFVIENGGRVFSFDDDGVAESVMLRNFAQLIPMIITGQIEPPPGLFEPVSAASRRVPKSGYRFGVRRR